MTKKELRKEFKQKRTLLSDKDMSRLDDLLLIKFQQWPIADIQTLLSYWPIKEKKEVNTHIMSDYLSFRIPALQLAFPVMDMNLHQLKAVLVNEETSYDENEYAIAEPVNGEDIQPEDIDAVFVPLLCFDEKGYRVGYGKGFYDRFLSSCREDVIRIGFSYFDPVPSIDDINDFDVPLNLCITPNKLYEF
jgi:5-formyltetrahydrofolate cyclo-ligase